MSEVERYLLSFLAASILVPAVVSTIYYKRVPRYGKFIAWYFYINVALELTMHVVAYTYGNNLFVLYIGTPLIATILGLAYSDYLKQHVAWYYLIVPIFAAYECATHGLFAFPGYTMVSLNLVSIVVVFHAFMKGIRLLVHPCMYYFNAVLLFASLSTSAIYFTANYLQMNNIDLMRQVFAVHAYLNCGLNLAYAASIWALHKSLLSYRV